MNHEIYFYITNYTLVNSYVETYWRKYQRTRKPKERRELYELKMKLQGRKSIVRLKSCAQQIDKFEPIKNQLYTILGLLRS
jgi:hypothetical protein